jgi:hypothetical protein
VSRQIAKRGEWKPEYPRQQIRFSNLDKDGVIRNGRPNLPYLPRDPDRRARLLALLHIPDDAQFVGKDDDE